jgi:DNA-binding ferritin-like protein (Dps family)
LKFKKWISARGVSDDAADMKNFQLNETSALSDFDATLSELKAYQDKAKSYEAVIEKNYTQILDAFEKGLDEVKEDTDNMRMLADDMEEFAIMEMDDTSTDAFDAGNDNQIEESEAEVAMEIDQAEPTQALTEIEDISEADQGIIGDDASVDVNDSPSDSDSGSSTMKMIMIIGGVLLVLALCAAGAYVY